MLLLVLLIFYFFLFLRRRDSDKTDFFINILDFSLKIYHIFSFLILFLEYYRSMKIPLKNKIRIDDKPIIINSIKPTKSNRIFNIVINILFPLNIHFINQLYFFKHLGNLYDWHLLIQELWNIIIMIIVIFDHFLWG